MSRYSPPIALSMALLISLTACSKKAEQPSEPAPSEAATATQTTSPAAATEQASEQEREKQAELAKKQGQLDYATMEDGYINDPKAQWASSAKASSTFGDDKGEPSASRLATNIIGKVDGKTWTNNSQDIGFDWVEVGFEKPVHATEVRFVLPDGRAAAAVSKVELIEPNGTAHVIWSGVSDTQTDKRGPRTWFVRQFDATPYQVSAVKLTIANNLDSNYKELDAVQIVGN